MNKKCGSRVPIPGRGWAKWEYFEAFYGTHFLSRERLYPRTYLAGKWLIEEQFFKKISLKWAKRRKEKVARRWKVRALRLPLRSPASIDYTDDAFKFIIGIYFDSGEFSNLLASTRLVWWSGLSALPPNRPILLRFSLPPRTTRLYYNSFLPFSSTFSSTLILAYFPPALEPSTRTSTSS